MPYVPFYAYFPDIADLETRTIRVYGNSGLGLPTAHYALIEMYYDEEICDCQRVFFFVGSSLTKKIEAVIANGWESPEFYAKWMNHNDPEIKRVLKGPILNSGSYQSHLAPLLLSLVQERVLQDQTYVQRLKTHYWTFRYHIDTRPKRKARRKV